MYGSVYCLSRHRRLTVVNTNDSFSISVPSRTQVPKNKTKRAILPTRITSYNVCYMKLLRPVFDKAAQNAYMEERVEELKTIESESITRLKTQSENRKTYLNSFFRFFKTGHGYYYPAVSFEAESSDNSYCIFLGFDINPKRNNPYAPSAVKLRFAIADSRKYIVLPASGDTAKEISYNFV